MGDILAQIVAAKEDDYHRLGPTFGTSVPTIRSRPLVQFLKHPGLVLEIKRASPSKGDIALNLDPVDLAHKYRDAHAKGISILTENRYFKGSLEDLVRVGRTVHDVALLRKDFLTHEDEIDVSFHCGADAVLLIARILTEERLRLMAVRCRQLGMTPFVEIHNEEDGKKLKAVLHDGPAVAGVNSRNLRTFSIDPLLPAAMRDSLPCKAIYESGADSSQACVYARSLGYDGMLIGESVARNPERAQAYVDAFRDATPNRSGRFWKEVAKRRQLQRGPLVKVCGITNTMDAEAAASHGASLLGFIFAESPRRVDVSTVRSIVRTIRTVPSAPLMVGVVTELESEDAHQAIRLAREGVLDALQCHGQQAQLMISRLDKMFSDEGIGRYGAIGIDSEEDLAILKSLLQEGEPRVLCDTKLNGKSGGTGQMIQREVLEKIEGYGNPWLAGGLGPDTIASLLDSHTPELIDVSSRLESTPGKKDHALLEQFFKEVHRGF